MPTPEQESLVTLFDTSMRNMAALHAGELVFGPEALAAVDPNAAFQIGVFVLVPTTFKEKASVDFTPDPSRYRSVDTRVVIEEGDVYADYHVIPGAAERLGKSFLQISNESYARIREHLAGPTQLKTILGMTYEGLARVAPRQDLNTKKLESLPEDRLQSAQIAWSELADSEPTARVYRSAHAVWM